MFLYMNKIISFYISLYISLYKLAYIYDNNHLNESKWSKGRLSYTI